MAKSKAIFRDALHSVSLKSVVVLGQSGIAEGMKRLKKSYILTFWGERRLLSMGNQYLYWAFSACFVWQKRVFFRQKSLFLG